MLVIADTTPLNYLVLVDAIEFLPRLYRQVILPRGAWQELQHPSTPRAVVQWARTLPDWMEVRDAPTSTDPALEALGTGEREAITLAELYRPGSDVLLLLDERAARQEAATRRIAATGTLGVLKAVAAKDWIDLEQAFRRLRETNFRVSEKLLRSLLDEEVARKKALPSG